jgi:glycosyltransferase involved in cell wall biosynthesis
VRLAFISDYYHPSIGGTQMLCKTIAEFFEEQGHEIEIITSLDFNRKLTDYNYRIKQFDSLDFRNSDIFINSEYDHVFVLCDLFSAPLQTIDFSTINNSTLILNLDENVYSWIENELNGFTKQNVQFLVNQLKSATNVVSFCKNAPVNKFLDENQINYHFIPNFSRDVLASKDINLDLKTKLKLGDKKIMFNHGNVEYRKNQLPLIKSCLYANLTNEYKLILLGSPRSEHDMKYQLLINKFLSENDKNNDVILLKGTNNMNLVDQCLKEADLFILPSLAEGLPLVLLEAMSAGLPWISTPCGGVPAVLGDLQSGVVLEDFELNPEHLEAAVTKVKNSNSRSDWEEGFTREKSCTKYSELL